MPPGNPPDSKWRATPAAARKRKYLHLTLSEDAITRLKELAAERGRSASQIVEELIIAAAPR